MTTVGDVTLVPNFLQPIKNFSQSTRTPRELDRKRFPTRTSQSRCTHARRSTSIFTFFRWKTQKIIRFSPCFDDRPTMANPPSPKRRLFAKLDQRPNARRTREKHQPKRIVVKKRDHRRPGRNSGKDAKRRKTLKYFIAVARVARMERSAGVEM